MSVIVVGVRKGHGVPIPVVLVLVNVPPWHRDYRSVVSFDLSVGFRVTCGRKDIL